MKPEGRFVLLVSVHGLIRGQAPELGRDPDTGGQVLYVLELARALADHSQVAQVDVLTRQVFDTSLPSEYAQAEESLGPHARILRLPFGPRRYLRKELLWDHLDHLVDAYLAFARTLPRLPDLIHSHYGDAGYVAMRISSLLSIPFIHSGHSLGRCKQASMLITGGKASALERQFHFARRIRVEEEVLSQASLIIASTRQEVVEQYGLYTQFQPRRTTIIPPGTDTSRFSPPDRQGAFLRVAPFVDRFLKEPRKPMLLCIGRPVPRKNLLGLIQAYGEDPTLRSRANLVIIAGNRDDFRDLDDTCRGTWEAMLHLIDRWDLYGHVAIPKAHRSEDIPDYYRLAAHRKGLCVNPALSETFGLTLIEAAASGLPLVATDQGGPKDIIANCRNGLLVDVSHPANLAATLQDALSNPRRWAEWSRNGIRGVRDFYTWKAHVERYLKGTLKLLKRGAKRRRKALCATRTQGATALLQAERVLVLDLDRTLIGSRTAMAGLMAWIRRHRERFVFGVATGRRCESALWVLRDWGVEPPDVLISNVGSEIHYGPDWRPDTGWRDHVCMDWRRDALAHALTSVPGIRLQAQQKQGPFKLSYYVNSAKLPPLRAIEAQLHGKGLRANLVYSQCRYLDVLPRRSSKGQAVRYLAYKWGIPIEQVIVAGDSGSDLDMLTGRTLSIVVANHSPEIAHLRGREGIYFAERPFAEGVLEGLEHFGLRGDRETDRRDDRIEPARAGGA